MALPQLAKCAQNSVMGTLNIAYDTWSSFNIKFTQIIKINLCLLILWSVMCQGELWMEREYNFISTRSHFRMTTSVIRNMWQEKGMEGMSQQGWKEERPQSTWTERHWGKLLSATNEILNLTWTGLIKKTLQFFVSACYTEIEGRQEGQKGV